MSWIIVKFVVLFILLLLSGFFSGSETALIGLGKVRARSLLKRNVKSAEEVQKFVNEPESLLTTVLIGNNVVNIAASVIATSIAIDYFGGFGVGIAMGMMTFLILTFCEIAPKTFAVQYPERISIIASKPLHALEFALRPFIRFFGLITSALKKILSVQTKEKSLISKEDEMKAMLDIGEEEGAIEEDEKEMMEGVLKLDHITVKNVMIPKEKMVCLKANQSVDASWELIKKYGYSRIPVFSESNEKVEGILYAKDLLIKANGRDASLKSILKPAYFVKETKRVDDLLKEFQKGKFHIAIVVNGEGGITGLVTLEDLLEEIVGSIYDEYDVIKIKDQKGE